MFGPGHHGLLSVLFASSVRKVVVQGSELLVLSSIRFVGENANSHKMGTFCVHW